MKPTQVVSRLHEQREHPEKFLRLVLKKGVFVEELHWDHKTEKTTIFRRLILKNFTWTTTNKKRYLKMVFLKQDMQKEKLLKQKLVKQIVDEQYPVLAYSFFDHIISSTVQKLNGCPPKEAEKLATKFSEQVVVESKKNKLVEV